MGLVTAAKERMDAYVNGWSGLGDLMRDPTMSTRPSQVVEFSDTELDNLFDDDHIANKICSQKPKDGLRKWCKLKIETEGGDDQEDGDAILAFLEDIGARRALRESLTWTRQRGGCLLIPGINDGKAPDQPLNEDAILSFTHVNVVRPDEARPHRLYEDPLAPKYQEVEYWEIKPNLTRAPVIIHESRVIHLRGELTSPERAKKRRGWDMSVLQRAKGPLQRNGQSWQAVANLLLKSNVLAFGVDGFSQMVKGVKGTLEAFANRTAVARMTQSVNSWLVFDSKSEAIDNITVNFSGVPEVMDRQMMEVSSAADMPVTKLWGRSPAGQNATGDSDLQMWDSEVEVYQEEDIRPPLERMVRLAMLTAGSATNGREPESWTLTFNPLRVMSEEQEAALQLQYAQALALLLDRDVFTPEEVALGPLFGEGGTLAGLADIDIDSRKAMLAADLKRMVENAKNPPTPPVAPPKPGDPEEDDEDKDPAPGTGEE